MKKLTLFVTLILASCLALSSCMANTPQSQRFSDTQTENYEDYGNNGYDYTDYEETEIKDPVIDWWKIYNDTAKKNCITIQVSNPNSFPIGFSFNLVYYKNNEVVKAENMWAVTCVEPNKPGIIYGDIDIPSASEVDRVEIENIEATEFQWKVLDSTFTETFKDNDKQYFDASFSGKPRQTEIWVALYNDTNADKSIQPEEFLQMGLLAPFVGIYEEKGEISIPLPDETLNYTDYRIYCLAFTMENAK